MVSALNTIVWPPQNTMECLTAYRSTQLDRIRTVLRLFRKPLRQEHSCVQQTHGCTIKIRLYLDLDEIEFAALDWLGARKSFEQLPVKFVIRDSKTLGLIALENHVCDVLSGEETELKYCPKERTIAIRVEVVTPVGMGSIFKIEQSINNEKP